MSPIQIKSNRATAAGHWFLRSGIQEVSGGVARYYKADLGRNAPVSTEITGYAVSAFSLLYQLTGEREYLEAATRAADFLVERAWMPEPGIWPFEHSGDVSDFNDQAEPLAYFFDTGIIVRGLVALWRITAEPRLLEAAVRGCESLSHFDSGNASHPIIRVPSLDPLPYTSRWSRMPGCYQLKSAMALLEVANITGRSDFQRQYENALQAAVASSETFLPAETPDLTMDRLHAFCYFLEAILPASERPEIKSVLANGIDSVSCYLRQIRPTFERSDVNAQLLRVRLLADRSGAVKLNRDEASEEASRIPDFQIASGDVRTAGGYSFGWRDGALVPHTNPVSTAFCMQALTMWSDYGDEAPLDIASLI